MFCSRIGSNKTAQGPPESMMMPRSLLDIGSGCSPGRSEFGPSALPVPISLTLHSCSHSHFPFPSPCSHSDSHSFPPIPAKQRHLAYIKQFILLRMSSRGSAAVLAFRDQDKSQKNTKSNPTSTFRILQAQLADCLDISQPWSVSGSFQIHPQMMGFPWKPPWKTHKKTHTHTHSLSAPFEKGTRRKTQTQEWVQHEIKPWSPTPKHACCSSWSKKALSGQLKKISSALAQTHTSSDSFQACPAFERVI